MQQALFGGGCFWCVEAIFLQLKGVEKVTSGYAGGTTVNPTYEDVCKGDTNHAEVILIDFDETQISYPQLLGVFFATHDPTTLNRQGNDVGTQYRSVIYYYNAVQQQQAADYIADLKAQDLDIVTELSPVPTFYAAEHYHQDFYNQNPEQAFCNFAIPPKLMKLRSKFKELMKEDAQ
ncbi:peptide-methionine (S)-S-oxide reductase MsrA [Acinetobacter larvae]|uniref:Peptide methionine sulfoxide reductase MsrA n=1 Tax=Acinetobacter larvae TaxID=1789224 RepID=A0A1B2M2K9_9GAMM|nr:peptide-methionine (S)-S-oxide reductase MsrA [Acinetobacter larvae]AOA59422.1 peptide-methionine (S)-S-oxide reductase [Acinetobacter larvae]